MDAIDRYMAREDARRKWRDEAFTDEQRGRRALLGAFVAWLTESGHWIATTGYLETYDDAYVVSERVDAEDVAELIAAYCEKRPYPFSPPDAEDRVEGYVAGFPAFNAFDDTHTSTDGATDRERVRGYYHDLLDQRRD